MRAFVPPGLASGVATKVGYVRDYISDLEVRATPEEVDAVQVFSRRLVEDYDYPKAQIQTRPQFRVRKRPSDEAKSYPIDIAVFSAEMKHEETLFLVVECKKKNRRDGLAQLKLYLDMSPAELGVWFNGDEHVYIRKLHHKSGTREYQELPNIPRFGQRIDDIGLYQRSELRAPSNLKAVFRDIRNHLAGMTTGITRDEALAQEIINLLFCKILDEQDTDLNDIVSFRAGIGESPGVVKKRIEVLFEKVKNRAYGDVFRANDTINLDAESIRYVVGELQNYCVMEADRDAIGDAFEVFIGPALRGAEGQFFTPRNVVKMVVDILNPQPGERIIDPACGSGGFLIAALEHVWTELKGQAKRKRWTERQLGQREVQVATDCFRGIDKDSFLAKVCKAYMALIGDGRGGIFCENTLARATEWSRDAQSKIAFGTFDVVMTNPPFGSKISIKGATLLSQYDLGHKWKRNKSTKIFSITGSLEAKRPPQILFLERCLQFLKPGGRMGIVLPESILGNPSYQYITDFIDLNATILGIVTMPEALFKTSGKGGTHTKVAVLFLKKEIANTDHGIYMADVKWCGHDSRGNPTLRKDPTTGLVTQLDEVPLIPGRYKELLERSSSRRDHLGYLLKMSEVKNQIFIPKYYDPEIDADISKLRSTHTLITLADMVKRKIVSLSTGVEPGKMAYGTGNIPFIRTSDLSSWEIKSDFKHGVSEDIFDEYRSGADVKSGDILIVRDGTYLIGTSAIVTDVDLPMLFQSHIIRIRVLKPQELDPWLFFACLNMPIVKRQIRAKQFTQDIIDTLGKRLVEIAIPMPNDQPVAKRVGAEVKAMVEAKAAMRARAKAIALELQGVALPKAEDLEAIEII